ncbi:hypothetical protein B0H16DRAFT_1693328 [Mycena metata]|uniref:Uncharacterized protein n=1 Tax=Mycena metata TaxID=1033252 RepID=A0AAD7N318_9AGAR|nr:hypothetical protein B0H16DRAFT_1693328 [Mycena metata]
MASCLRPPYLYPAPQTSSASSTTATNSSSSPSAASCALPATAAVAVRPARKGRVDLGMRDRVGVTVGIVVELLALVFVEEEEEGCVVVYEMWLVVVSTRKKLNAKWYCVYSTVPRSLRGRIKKRQHGASSLQQPDPAWSSLRSLDSAFPLSRAELQVVSSPACKSPERLGAEWSASAPTTEATTAINGRYCSFESSPSRSRSHRWTPSFFSVSSLPQLSHSESVRNVKSNFRRPKSSPVHFEVSFEQQPKAGGYRNSLKKNGKAWCRVVRFRNE